MHVCPSHASIGPPSGWVTRWASHLRPGSTVLDVACGSGRHVSWLARRGLRVTGVDRDAQALEQIRTAQRQEGQGPPAELLLADLESGPWPLDGRRFDAVVVTNYLWRPLAPRILASLAPEGGVLMHETFAEGNESVGRPARPEFLLHHGELLEMARAACAWWPTRTAFCPNPSALCKGWRRCAKCPPRSPHAGRWPEAGGQRALPCLVRMAASKAKTPI